MVLVVKNPPASVGDIRDVGSIPGSERSPGDGNGNPLQYSCLENPLDRRAWQDPVYKVTKSWTQLKWLRTQSVSNNNIMDFICYEANWIVNIEFRNTSLIIKEPGKYVRKSSVCVGGFGGVRWYLYLFTCKQLKDDFIMMHLLSLSYRARKRSGFFS